jgi:pyridoxal 5'-phosphate synthase pdxT subunit
MTRTLASRQQPVVGVLALQGDFRAHGQTLQGLGAATREVRVPADLEGLDALILQAARARPSASFW